MVLDVSNGFAVRGCENQKQKEGIIFNCCTDVSSVCVFVSHPVLSGFSCVCVPHPMVFTCLLIL